MRAVEIIDESGPRTALKLVDLPIPPATHELAPDDAVLIDVKAAGVSFPELLQTYGQYQIRPACPFVPGSEVAGFVRAAPNGSSFRVGERVAAFVGLGGFAEVAAAPSWLTVPLPDWLDFAQGASLILNYHTAYFAMVVRGRVVGGETILVHGAAGGIGTAALQIARGLGVKSIALVSSDPKEEIARSAGADEVLRVDCDWKDKVVARGRVDAVLDPVGGQRVVDSLRSLRYGGRLIVVGFASGEIPSVKLNRLLLRNLDVVGVDWGFSQPELNKQVAHGVNRLVEEGQISPIVGHRFPLEQAAAAVSLIEGRRALGKVVLEVDGGVTGPMND